MEQPSEVGQWGDVFNLPNVAVHSHLLPNGQVLMWGRRDNPGDSQDVQECTPFVWNPITGETFFTPKPLDLAGATVNLFCSGHAFLPDGRLLVAGGHIRDGEGVNQACIYDFAENTWTATATMNSGRWYPTLVTLADESILVCSGSYLNGGNGVVVNDVLQLWRDGEWTSIVNFWGLPLYPRLHFAIDGRVLMAGPLAQSYLLETQNGGQWTPLNNNSGGTRANGMRDYAPSVIYAPNQILFIGGGNNVGTQAPTSACEIIDLNATSLGWSATGNMNFPRRQHNATLTPDGAIIVTGGTRGGGGPNNGFNDLTPGQPVHQAEIWEPATGTWKILAEEGVDRCYHATALLLPDGRILSAGGGEYRPSAGVDNPPQDSHRNAQLFSPPYLFRGPRPTISEAPPNVQYGASFDLETPDVQDIERISLVRLGSVTHSFDQNQGIQFLAFRRVENLLVVDSPPSSQSCAPGHYMLFLVNAAGVPSIGRIIRIANEPRVDSGEEGDGVKALHFTNPTPQVRSLGGGLGMDVFQVQESIGGTPVDSLATNDLSLRAAALTSVREFENTLNVNVSLADSTKPNLVAGPAKNSSLEPLIPDSYLSSFPDRNIGELAERGLFVAVGVTGTCPYGIAACSGGAIEALGNLEGVVCVASVADAAESMVGVFLEDFRLPHLSLWAEQFQSTVHGTYILRGVEVTLRGHLVWQAEQLRLVGNFGVGYVELLPFVSTAKVQWDHIAGESRLPEIDESTSYARLSMMNRENLGEVWVRGPLSNGLQPNQLLVRSFGPYPPK